MKLLLKRKKKKINSLMEKTSRIQTESVFDVISITSLIQSKAASGASLHSISQSNRKHSSRSKPPSPEVSAGAGNSSPASLGQNTLMNVLTHTSWITHTKNSLWLFFSVGLSHYLTLWIPSSDSFMASGVSCPTGSGFSELQRFSEECGIQHSRRCFSVLL